MAMRIKTCQERGQNKDRKALRGQKRIWTKGKGSNRNGLRRSFAVITVSFQSLHYLGQGYYRLLLITAISINCLTLTPILLFHKIK